MNVDNVIRKRDFLKKIIVISNNRKTYSKVLKDLQKSKRREGDQKRKRKEKDLVVKKIKI